MRFGRPRLLANASAVAALAACALILHRDGLLGGPAFYEQDTRLFYYPLAAWVGQHLHAGVFPLWLPDIFTGYPIFADGELGLAYPPQVALLWLLPASLALVWLRVLHVFLAGLFTFVYCRARGLDVLPALGGALVFAFGSFVTAQMHHENVVRSAVWLPAVITCADGAIRRSGTLGWIALGALAFGQAALGLHVQPVLMLALALGAYGVYGVGLTRERAWRPLAWVAMIAVGGFAVAGVQWLPLGEWALVSSRRGGVDYEFASAFALAPQSLVSLVFPFFFRLADATTWWSLWQQWEIELYVGIPTLALMIVGIVFGRRSELVYFGLLLVIALAIAMASDAPLVNLHQFLWSTPGFSFLRAPGRFTYLVVFASACLAAFGLQVLQTRRLRIVVALLGGVPAVALLAALLALLPAWRTTLAGDPRRALTLANTLYLSARAQYPIDPQVVVDGALTSLDLTNPKTAWTLALLALTAACFVAWVALGQRRFQLAQALFVGLLAIDLLTFAADFHPRASLTSLAPTLPTGLTTGARVLLRDPADLPALEPDALVSDGVATVQGYSSLPSQRHVELDESTRAQPDLLDLWAAPFIIEPTRPPDLHQANGVPFRADHPLAAGFGGAPPVRFAIPPGAGPTREVRLIGTLSYAFAAPQAQTVATVSLDGQALPVRAGIELSERAFDRPSLRGQVQHARAPVALDLDEVTAEGEAYTGHLYAATLSLPNVVSPTSIVVTPVEPGVLVEIHGLALVDTNGVLHPLDLSNRDGLRRLGDEVVRNDRALPRAYVLPRAQGFSPARHPNLTATQLVSNPDVDLHTMVLIEGDPGTPSDPVSNGTPAVAANVEDVSPNVVRVTAVTNAPGYLVLTDFYQRGWTARVDGEPARVLIANALFRAVAIEPGSHVIEFRYEPGSLLLGAAVSAVSLLAILAALAFSVVHHRRRRETAPAVH